MLKSHCPRHHLPDIIGYSLSGDAVVVVVAMAVVMAGRLRAGVGKRAGAVETVVVVIGKCVAGSRGEAMGDW